MNYVKFALSLLTLIVGNTVICAQSSSGEMDLQIKQSLTFFSSFDEGFEAEFSAGDPHFYVAPSWEEREMSRELYSGGDHLQIQKVTGDMEMHCGLKTLTGRSISTRGRKISTILK